MNRRRFLTNAAGLVAGAAAGGPSAYAASPQQGAPAPVDARDAEELTTERSGSDCIVDVRKTLGLEHICANPGSSFRGLHESIVNYGANRARVPAAVVT